MKIDVNTILLLLIVLLTCYVVYMGVQGCTPEGFQDGSRAAIGWAAGPRSVYGFDPVEKYYLQMLEEKERRRQLGIPVFE